MARFEPNPEFVNEFRTEQGSEWQDRVGRLAVSSIQAFAPRETGFMKTAMRHEPFTDSEDRPSVRIISPADYTMPVDQGSGLYGPLKKYITPKAAKALSWLDHNTGTRVFAQRTRGQVGQRFFRRGLEAIFSRVVEHRHGLPGS